MKIAIIGAGNVGKALAKSSLRGGHKVTMSAASPENAAKAAKSVGAHAASSNVEAVKGADIVIIAVPYDKLGDVFRGLGSAVDDTIVIDATNHINTENPAEVLGAPSNAEEIQKRHPKVRVVKAFNYAFASRMADPTVDGIRLDGFVAGEDQDAKDKVLELVESIGFRPVDAGPLVMARVLEAMGLLNVTLQIRHNWPWQNGWKLVGPPA
ncbi:MAG: prephenate dehydrogenase/arogenate dehydrogenase family protein [Chloroflexi bacterium]|nr:MAG: prephenate dehydrogenase/arogenate dehydrogenase family protein [Chloroflexota bacterium]